MADSQVCLQRIEDGRFAQNSPGASDTCCICKRAIEYDADRGFWRFDDQFGEPATVVSVKHGDYVCGAKCHSQYVFNNSTECERDAMRALALMCEAWLSVEYNRLQWSYWSYSHLISTADLLSQEMISLMAAFGMEDGENPPAWYVSAIAPVAPAKPVEFVHLGLEVRHV